MRTDDTPFGDAAPPSALAGIRVVEIGSLEATSYCAKLFRDMGAEVLKLEPAEGDPLRRSPPLIAASGGSAHFAWLNAGKQAAVLPQDPAAQAAYLAKALAWADVLLDARASDPAGAERLRAAHPHLLVVSMSWFGRSGPYASFQGSDAVCRALAGLVKLAGPVEGPPGMLPDHQASVHAGLCAFTAAVAGLISERPEREFEVSVFEAAAVLQQHPASDARYRGGVERRIGADKSPHLYPLGVYPCRDGWLGLSVGNLKMWRAFCDVFGFHDWAADPELELRVNRIARMAEMDRRIAARVKEKTAAEWFEITRARRLPIVVTPTMGELLSQAAHRETGAFAEIEAGDASFQAPATPLRLSLTPPLRRGRAPGLRPLPPPDAPARRPPLSAPSAETRPLAGVTVLDLSMGWAGPLATRQLADLGAEVLKIEACAYPDWFRPSLTDKPRPHEQNPPFAVMNRGKLAAAVDMYRAEGIAVIRDAIRRVDAVVENFAADVMPKLGLSYDEVRRLNPRVVMLSMPAFSGHSAWRSVRAYGTTLEHASGLPLVAGGPGEPPMLSHTAYGDPNGGLNGAAALVAALFHQKHTGQGQHIDLSQVQAMLPLAANAMIEQSLTGAVTRHGAHHPLHAPHGVFRSRGDDAWIVVTVTDDRHWPALCVALGRDDLAARPELATARGRRAAADELHAAVSAWTAGRPPGEAMHALQAAGVPAGVATRPSEIYDDPHLHARGYWQEVDRAWTGPQLMPSAPFRERGAVYPIVRPAPTLGQHNRLILCERLGVPEATLDELLAAGVCGDDVPAAG
ncbi:CoA transferase [Phenylobacterium sp.]|uniref:CaiB/BaiF CoA-transferase family protein n=1 Tax=Phenylobacterium sp. TaxID=1871053 RepID=UPI0025F03EDE|nr:CoA transferase [Phenylobacterium sp.]MBX3484124.1 CoA transferase [Phenylobacterium sp.]